MIIKTVQWNIGGGKIRNKEDDPTDTYLYCQEGLEHIVKTLSYYKADIITLQETHTNNKVTQAAILAKTLNLPYFFNDVYNDSHLEAGQKLGGAILSKFPLEKHIYTFFSNPMYRSVGPRGEQWISHDKGVTRCLAQINKKIQLEIQTLHLIPFHRFNIDPLGHDAENVRKDIASKVKTDSALLLLQGDFNYNEPSLKKFLPDLIAGGTNEVVLTIPTTPKGKWYDHIVYKGLRHLKSTVNTSVLTDHFPVYSEFEV